MSSIEERLARDIAAVTGGIIMTDSDLREARLEVEQRTARRSGRRTVTAAVAAVAAAVLIPVLGVAAFETFGGDDKGAPAAKPPTDPSDGNADFLTGSVPTPQLIAGVWREDNGTTVVQFREDGTVRFDQHGTIFGQPATTGTYEIDGDVITVTATDDARSGCSGKQFAMHAALPESGAMRSVRTIETLDDCSLTGPGRLVWEQVLPTSQGLTEMVLSQDPGWKRVSDKATLYGLWLAEGGGQAIEIDPGGSYFLAGESGEPVDQGTWSFRGSELTLTSSAASADCSTGDRLVLGAVQQINPNTTGMRGTVKENTCGAARIPAAWFLIPHQDG